MQISRSVRFGAESKETLRLKTAEKLLTQYQTGAIVNKRPGQLTDLKQALPLILGPKVYQTLENKEPQKLERVTKNLETILDQHLYRVNQDFPTLLHQKSRVADIIKASESIAILTSDKPFGSNPPLAGMALYSRLSEIWPKKTIHFIRANNEKGFPMPFAYNKQTFKSEDGTSQYKDMLPITPAHDKKRQAKDYDTVIMLNMPDATQIDPNLQDVVKRSRFRINIDNQLENTQHGTEGLNWVNPFVGSTSVMIHELFPLLPSMSDRSALLLAKANYQGHARFMNTSHSAADHALFGEVLETGLDPQIHFSLARENPPHVIKLLGELWGNVKADQGLALTYVQKAKVPPNLKSEEVIKDLSPKLMELLEAQGVHIAGGLFETDAAQTQLVLRSTQTTLLNDLASAIKTLSNQPIQIDKPQANSAILTLPTGIKAAAQLVQDAYNTLPNRVTQPKANLVRFGSSAVPKELYGTSAFDPAIIKDILSTKNKSVLIVPHINPDGDTLGSALGLKLILEKLGKQVTVAADGSLNRDFKDLPGFFEVKHPNDPELVKKKSFDLAFLLDASGVDRAGRNQEHLAKGKTKIYIDHHPTPVEGFDRVWMDMRAVATAELITMMAQQLEKASKKKLLDNHEIQCCLYRGFATDTGSFLFGAGQRAHDLASLVSIKGSTPPPLKVSDSGVSLKKVTASHKPPIELIKLQGDVLKNMVVDPKTKAVYAYADKKMMEEAEKSITDKIQAGIPGYEDIRPQQVRDMMMDSLKAKSLWLMRTIRFNWEHPPKHVALFIQIGDKTRMSFRNQNAVEIAREFGGNGHNRAAGATIKENVENLIPKYTQIIANSKWDESEPRRAFMDYIIGDSLAVEKKALAQDQKA